MTRQITYNTDDVSKFKPSGVSDEFFEKYKSLKVVRVGWKRPPDERCGRKGEYIMGIFEVPSVRFLETENNISDLIKKLKAGHHVKLSSRVTIKLYK